MHERRFPHQKSVLVSLAVSLPILGLVWLARDWTHSGFGVSPAEANGAIHQRFRIPDDASQVSFLSTPRYSKVVFSISRTSFDRWAQQMRFRTRSITPHDPALGFRLMIGGGEKLVRIENGVSFTDGRNCGISGSFDASSRICYAQLDCQ